MTSTCANCEHLMTQLNLLLGRHERQIQTPPDDSDVQSFIAQCTALDGDVHVGLLYNRYVTWCRESGMSQRGKNSFGLTLTRLGFGVRRGSAGVRYRTGLSLT